MISYGKEYIKTSLTVFCCITCLLCIGCTLWGGFSYGKLRLNDDVRAAFEAFIVDSQYVYYTSGTDLYPRAIIGIRKDESFDPGFWKRRMFTADSLEYAIRNMQEEASKENLRRLYGFDIKDESGKVVGIWYSVLDVTPLIRRSDKGDLYVSTPPLDVYEKKPGRSIFPY